MSPKIRNLSPLFAILCTGALAAGCYKVQYKDSSAAPGTTHSVKQNFFLWGAVGGEQVDLRSLCPQGVAEIGSQHSFVDGLLYGVTGGLYSPMSAKVTCKGGTAYQLNQKDKAVEVEEMQARVED